MIFEIPMKISKLTKITGALNHTYPELSVARATLVFLIRRIIDPPAKNVKLNSAAYALYKYIVNRSISIILKSKLKIKLTTSLTRELEPSPCRLRIFILERKVQFRFNFQDGRLHM